MAITKLRQRGITDQAVGSTQIENSSVAAADIAPATITTTQIAPGTIAQADISPAVNLGVSSVTSDPPSPSEGDLWLRTDLKKLSTYLIGTASFATGTSMPYGFSQGAVNGPSYNDITQVCGYGGHPRTGGDNGARGYDHQQWNGSAWSQATNHPYANSGCSLTGTQSAGLTAGGHGNPSGPNSPIHPSYSATNISTEWDGSAWGSTASLNYAFSSGHQQHGHGTQSNTKIVNGWSGPSLSSQSQLYNGTSWAAEPSTPFSNQWFAGAGPTSDFIGWGSNTASNSYQWNGSAWSTGPSFSTPKQSAEGSRIGTANGPTNTGVLCVGSTYPTNNTCELWNGTSWSTDVNLHSAPAYSSSTGAHAGGGNTGGGNARGLVIGGGSPPYPGSLVAEYTGAALTTLRASEFSA